MNIICFRKPLLDLFDGYTQTPSNTPTPIFIPPPSDPNYIFLMIGIISLVMLTLILAVWIHRKTIADGIKPENGHPETQE